MSKKQLGPTTNMFPMPDALVAVKTGEETSNILAIAWCGVVWGSPPMLALDIGKSHYSTPFIEEEGCFTVNIPSSDMVIGADYCGMVSGRVDPHKANTCGWTMTASIQISAPLIEECPLNFECRVVKKVDTGKGTFYLAEVLQTHVDEAAMDGKMVDAQKLDPLIFTPDGYYHKLGERVAKAWDAGKPLKEWWDRTASGKEPMVTDEKVIRKGRGQRPGALADTRLDWWREAKFGLFIHWGLYAIPAGEWKGEKVPGIGEWIMYRRQIPAAEYEQLAAQFNPVKFDAAQWVAMAKAAGQKYIVITSKHHDGFCLFKSEQTDYSIVDGAPFKRDVIKELADECAKQGMRLGFYYSQTQDWHHPKGDGNTWDYSGDADDFAEYVETYVKPQVTELLTNYGPVALIWFDTPKAMTEEQSASLLDLVHELQPDCLVSGRLGNDLGDYGSAGDNQIPAVAVTADWETPATINDTWGFKADDQNWESVTDLIHKLVDIVSKNGNYLLNVGPTAEGVIPQESVDRLLGMGEWLKVNGDAIYGTTPGPIQGVEWCRTTAQGETVYLHVLDWPEGGQIVAPGLGGYTSATLLSNGVALDVSQSGDDLVIAGPATAPDDIDTVIALTA